MNSKANKRKGASYETDLVKTIREDGFETDRLPKVGSKDEGDLVVRLPGFHIVLEAKNVKTITLPEFIRQAQEEANNYSQARGCTTFGAAVIKRRNQSIEKSFTVMELGDYLDLLKLFSSSRI